MGENHSCTANAVPLVDSQHDGTPVVSATLDDDGLEMYARCRVCRDELVVEYEYCEARPA